MRVPTILVTSLIVSFCAATALLFYLHSDPSTSEIDSDIEVVRSQIAATEAEAAKYEGGLIHALIGVRLEVLRTTEDILQQKRTSFIRKVNLKYTVEPNSPTTTQQQLDAIAAEITATQAELQADESRANQYTGGFIQGLALATVATRQLTLAQLQLSYLGAKYGFVLPQIQPSSVEKEKAEPPGTPTEDPKAFD